MIKFGTSGWRGIIGEDFTFENVRIASQGIANYLRKSGQRGSGVIIAYDTRFLSEKFSSEAAKILAFNDIHAFLCNRDVPTPCVSYEIVRRKAMGAINFTASHNPPEYNGLKFSTSNGAPALPEITQAIESEIHAVASTHERLDDYEKSEQIETIDPKDRYLAEPRNKADVDVIRKSGLRIAIDSPNVITALVALYLRRYGNIPGGLARSVTTTHLIDAIARKLDVPLYETPVGFKYIGELILADKIALGGEESAGMSMYRHLPEKDGILACLLVAEMVARTGKRLHELTEEMHQEFGFFYSKRTDMKLTTQLKETLAKKLTRPPAALNGLKVRDVNTTDGVKLIFDQQRWLLFRLSGTEPVARVYAEACSPKELKDL